MHHDGASFFSGCNDAALAQGLVFAFCGDEMTIHAADVFKFDVFGALGRACAGVGAVSESEFVHLVDHGYKDLLENGSLAAARDKGLVGLEGKEYVVKDGDVILFRFNV